MVEDVVELNLPPFLNLNHVFNVELFYPHFPPLLDTLGVAKNLRHYRAQPWLHYGKLQCIEPWTPRWRAPTSKTYNFNELSTQHNIFTGTSGWPTTRSSRSFPTWYRNLMRWGPLLLKVEKLIHVVIQGHLKNGLDTSNFQVMIFWHTFGSFTMHF